MQPRFDFIHLDPSSDPPEPYQEAFELLGELWAKLPALKRPAPKTTCCSAWSVT